MTVSRATTVLFSFRSKIEEAVSLVPRMGATEKLKAVQFWNAVSEKLQDIVNKNAADINAIALKLGDADDNKLCLEMSNLTSNMDPLNNTSAANFMNTSSISEIYDECSTQFHSAELNNTHLKHQFPSEPVSSNNETLNQQTEVTHVPHIHHINQDIDMPQHENEGVCDGLLSVPAHSGNSNNTLVKVSQSESLTTCNKMNNNYSLNQDVSQSSSTKMQHSQSSSPMKKEHLVDTSDVGSVNFSSLIRSEKDLNHDSVKVKCKTKVNSRKMSDSEDSFNGTDYESAISLEELVEEKSEHVSFVVSNSEVGLENNKEYRLQRKNKKNCNVSISYNCKVCGKQYSNHHALKQHNLVHKKPYPCTECTSVFATNASLIVHMRKHTGEKPYACHKCSACFSTQGNLKRHVGKHDGAKPWKCSECDSCFTEKKSLTIHMRRHTGERPYKCKICGKGFTQTGVLESHMAMHLGIKKHLCEKCGKAFRQKSQLRVHRLRHENVKRFKCDICSTLFLTKADLERHVKTHSGEKPYACDICNKKFTRQQSLNDHLNRHYGIKPYVCEHCGKRFVEMSSYYKHIKFHNKEGNRGDPAETGVNNHNQEAHKSEDNVPTAEAGNTENVMPLLKDKNIDNRLPTIEEGTQYIAVVLNSEEACEAQNLNNQTILYNSGSSENNIGANNFGVLTAINLLPNASIIPAGFLS